MDKNCVKFRVLDHLENGKEVILLVTEDAAKEMRIKYKGILEEVVESVQ